MSPRSCVSPARWLGRWGWSTDFTGSQWGGMWGHYGVSITSFCARKTRHHFTERDLGAQ